MSESEFFVGAIAIATISLAEITDCLLINNRAERMGGELLATLLYQYYLIKARPEIRLRNYLSTAAKAGVGGSSVAINSTYVVSINGSRFELCGRGTQMGGCIYFTDGQLTLNNSQIHAGAAAVGGGLFANSTITTTETTGRIQSAPVLSIFNTHFTGCTATSKDGGALAAYNLRSLSIIRSTFTSNSATVGIGGACTVTNCRTVRIQLSKFQMNSANSAGAVSVTRAADPRDTEWSSATLTNNSFVGNSATALLAGGLLVDLPNARERLQLRDNQFINNTAFRSCHSLSWRVANSITDPKLNNRFQSSLRPLEVCTRASYLRVSQIGKEISELKLESGVALGVGVIVDVLDGYKQFLSGCFEGQLIWNVTGGNSLPLVQDAARFDRLLLYGTPGTNSQIPLTLQSSSRRERVTRMINTSFASCQPGSFINTFSVCQRCAGKQYSAAKNQRECQECPTSLGITCHDGLWHNPADVWVRVDPSDFTIKPYQCPTGRCLAQKQCALNRQPYETNVLCANCIAQHSEVLWSPVCVTVMTPDCCLVEHDPNSALKFNG